MTETNPQLSSEAVAFIKSNKSELIRKFANPEVCRPVSSPVSLFMAGSPGAGKTEVSKNLVKKFRDVPVRIDADEIRAICPGYTGTNAHIFQDAANKGVNILFDYALHKHLNLILDATFAYTDAQGNIQRSIDRNRIVQIWFVYQDPLKAWEVTKAREVKEARHVSKEVFIETFFRAKKNVSRAKEMFGSVIELNLLIKDYDGIENSHFNISEGELDRYLKDGYTENDLKMKLV